MAAISALASWFAFSLSHWSIAPFQIRASISTAHGSNTTFGSQHDKLSICIELTREASIPSRTCTGHLTAVHYVHSCARNYIVPSNWIESFGGMRFTFDEVLSLRWHWNLAALTRSYIVGVDVITVKEKNKIATRTAVTSAVPDEMRLEFWQHTSNSCRASCARVMRMNLNTRHNSHCECVCVCASDIVFSRRFFLP